jgi:2-haloacid dehalogenase
LPIRAVTLDAYGTLFDLDSIIGPAVGVILQEQGIDLAPEELLPAWTGRFFRLLEDAAPASGFRTNRELSTEALRGAFSEFGVSGDAAAAADRWFELARGVRLFPEARRAVEALSRAYRLALVSDTDDDVFLPAWRRAALPIERVFTSESQRAYKMGPGGGLLARAFEALGVEPDEVAHVGDTHFDVVAAARAGACPVWISRDGRDWRDPRARPALVCRDLLEAAERLVRGS